MKLFLTIGLAVLWANILFSYWTNLLDYFKTLFVELSFYKAILASICTPILTLIVTLILQIPFSSLRPIYPVLTNATGKPLTEEYRRSRERIAERINNFDRFWYFIWINLTFLLCIKFPNSFFFLDWLR